MDSSPSAADRPAWKFPGDEKGARTNPILSDWQSIRKMMDGANEPNPAK
jgi:hypothetical protein